MKNERTAILTGTFARSFPNYHREADKGKYFTAGLIDVTLEHEKYAVKLRFKAHGQIAKQIIEQIKKGTQATLTGVFKEELKSKKNPEFGSHAVIVLDDETCGEIKIIKKD